MSESSPRLNRAPTRRSAAGEARKPQPDTSASETASESTTPSADSVIELRDAGKSYAAIARKLAMSSSVQAQAAFVNALRGRPEDERNALTERELARLEVLEHKIRDDDGGDPARTSQRLGALEKLRSALQ